MNQHLSQGRSVASRAAARASLRAAAARGRVDALNTRFAERSAELRRRLAAGRAGEPDEAGLESIEVVVLSVVGLGIAIALGAAIKGLVDRYMAQLGGGG
ncbi:hypothetical protein APR04_004359 [Promicromonospora umidemergens]|uniref:Uncharacterized protein n=1 Tax=Promicromonospora umidemergens TaxID=629679 RepID=A0ABP8XQP2_9MICO|nr:hypothetical protein [Promicromonospora umidemergens]MCP2285427.1 hypothetical protein [Promicromonospora umidemergens]